MVCKSEANSGYRVLEGSLRVCKVIDRTGLPLSLVYEKVNHKNKIVKVYNKMNIFTINKVHRALKYFKMAMSSIIFFPASRRIQGQLCTRYMFVNFFAFKFNKYGTYSLLIVIIVIYYLVIKKIEEYHRIFYFILIQ